jgi:hypothetical protein
MISKKRPKTSTDFKTNSISADTIVVMVVIWLMTLLFIGVS